MRQAKAPSPERSLGIPESWPTEARELLRQAQAKLTDELAIAWDGYVYEWSSDSEAGPIQTMSVNKSVVPLSEDPRFGNYV